MKPIKKAIVLCWIMLVACFAIKLFGGNWFEVVCTNEHFSNLCDFIDENLVFHHIFSFIVYFVPSVFMIMAISLKPSPNKKQLWAVFVGLIIVWVSKFISINLKSVMEFLNAITMPILLEFVSSKNWKNAIKSKWYLGFIGYFTVFAFQFLSLITRNISLKIIEEKLFIIFILLIDYYIMVILYYLYIKSWKGENKNG